MRAGKGQIHNHDTSMGVRMLKKRLSAITGLDWTGLQCYGLVLGPRGVVRTKPSQFCVEGQRAWSRV